ncbi:MAG: hypothetical protein FWG85_03500 [Bacteroidetes bacterium]|nr:hypothetical protein [Bacteroidota bacterium]
MKIKITAITAIIFATTFVLNAQTVTSDADSGPGSLRQVIADAADGATITFASSVTSITLTSSEIRIQKNLTINGGTGNSRVTISGNNNKLSIFNVSGSYSSPNYNLSINNLVISDAGNRAVDMSNYFSAAGGNFTATNCEFNNNGGTR